MESLTIMITIYFLYKYGNKNKSGMLYKVLMKGRTPIYSHVKKVVAHGLTWQEAYNKVWLLHDLYGGSWDIWFTHE